MPKAFRARGKTVHHKRNVVQLGYLLYLPEEYGARDESDPWPVTDLPSDIYIYTYYPSSF